MQSLANASEPLIEKANLNRSVARDDSIIQEELDSNGFEGSGITENELSTENEIVSVKEAMKTSPLKSASRSRIGARSIIGSDQRIFVSDTTAYPFRAMTYISSTQGDCSGVLTGKDTVLTAGHCLYFEGIWNSKVLVYPGSNGLGSPYGVCSAKSFYVAPEWLAREDDRYDYGVVKLDCDVGLQTGWIGWHVQAGSMNDTKSYISGYPGDKVGTEFFTQWYSADRIRISGGRILYYKNDTVGGMSGAPVVTPRPLGSAGCERACIIAVHSNTIPALAWNAGTRITSDVAANLIRWRDAP